MFFVFKVGEGRESGTWKTPQEKKIPEAGKKKKQSEVLQRSREGEF